MRAFIPYQPGRWERSIAGGQNAYVVWRHYFMLDGLIGMVSVTSLLSAENNLERGTGMLLYSIRLASGKEREPEYTESVNDLLPYLRLADIATAKKMIQRWLCFVGNRLLQLDYHKKGKQAIYTAIQGCLYQPDITVVTYGRTDEERNISRLLATNALDSIALAIQLADTLGIDLYVCYFTERKDYGGWCVLTTYHDYRKETGTAGYIVDSYVNHILT